MSWLFFSLSNILGGKTQIGYPLTVYDTGEGTKNEHWRGFEHAEPE